MSHQIAYAITDRLPAEILAGDRIQAPAPGGNQHPPERVILIVGEARIVVPNGLGLDVLGEIGGDLIRLADEAGAREEPSADAPPAKKSRKKSQDTETPAA